MPRLQKGEDARIDRINELVEHIKSPKNKQDLDASFIELIDMFKPLLLKVCDKWSKYFHDEDHHIISFDALMVEAQYWFMTYTMEKYTIDGIATFNNFIKNHVDQRIRYIYECELKYYKRNIFPDPKDDNDNSDQYELVAHKYSSEHHQSIEGKVIDSEISIAKKRLAQRIMELTKSKFLTDRERQVFIGVVCEGKTHDEVGRQFNISRTRVTQVLKKAKGKMYSLMDKDKEVWDLIIKADMDFEEQ